MALLLYSEQQMIKPISANNQAKYSLIEKETEEDEIKKILGIAFLQFAQDNLEDVNVIKLLDGDTFVNCDGETVKFKGLKYIIAYFCYNRYLDESFINDTFSGMVQKNRPDSTQLTTGQINKIKQNNSEIAYSEVEIMKQYLNENTLIFPLWKSCNYIKPTTPKFLTLRKYGI